MKTILSGIKTWTRGEICKSTADWSQNDPNADNYVKNRTHWEEDVKIPVLPKQQIPAIYPYGSLDENYCFDLEEGATYVITFNGTRYELTAWYCEQWGYNVAGNSLYLEGVDNGSDIPFAFDGYGINAPYGIYTISVSTLVNGIETEVIEEQTVYNIWEQPLGEFPLELGSVYSVNFDGNTYEFTATENPDFSVVSIGDMTQYPFEMLYIDEYLILCSTVPGIHTISLTDVTNDTQIIVKEYIGDYVCYEDINNFDLQMDQIYTVVWNNKVYSCVAKDIAEGCICIGNPIYAYLQGWNDVPVKNTNEPFFIVIDKLSDWIGIYFDCEKPHTFSVFITETVVHKLDSKIHNSVHDIANQKMDAANPQGTGSFSMNRKYNSTVGNFSHAEGHRATASGYCSHAEGSNTTASGDYSHAEGSNTIANGNYSHAQGKFNVEDTSNKYAHIVGNGSTSKQSNAHTLDWNGNAWFAGNIYIGGTGQDDTAAIKVAVVPFPTEADEGKFLRVINGVPTWVSIPNAEEATF